MSKLKIPSVSVILPVHNNAQVLKSALDSAASQNLPMEIIIVDDCSTDGSEHIIKKWQSDHPEANPELIKLPEHKFAHFARIEGIRQAKTDNIAFMDADDSFTNNGCLARALQEKVETGADIVHFRALGREGSEIQGELGWAAPFCECSLHGQEIFRKFAECPYPPWTVWGKIFSRSLLLEILPVLESVSLHGAEDAFLCTLAFATAKSYLGFGEYGYIYNIPQNWPMSRFARRIQGILAIAPVLKSALQKAKLEENLISSFLHKLEAIHTVMDAGRLAKQMETRMFNGEMPEAILHELAPYANKEQIFTALLLAGKNNTDRLVSIVRRYFGFENLDE